jgi:MscS family membrane protein
MKPKFETAFRAIMLGLLLVLLGAVWAVAQSNTNTSLEAPQTPTAPVTQAKGFERLESYALTFGLDRIPLLRETTIVGEPLWKYISSLLYIFLAFYVSKIIDYVSCVWLRRWAAKTQSRLDDLLLDLLHGPIKVVAFVILLHLGINIFRWPHLAQKFFTKALVLVVAGSLTYLALKMIGMFLDFWRTRSLHEADHRFNDQLFSVIRKSINAFVIVVAVLVTAQNMGINITAVITSLSIGGLAVGLAAQDTLANLFGAVAIFADKPFRVGDQIKLDVIEGIVEAVGLRSTRVRNAEGYLVSIPNKTVGNSAITNITRRSSIKTTMNLALAFDLSAEKVKQAISILDQVYRNHPLTEDLRVSFNQFAGRNLNILVIHWCKGTDYDKYLAGMQEMNLALKERFDREGIKLA